MIGDVNGDGVDDIDIGAAVDSPGGRTMAGTLYVIFGWPKGPYNNIFVSTLNSS